MTRRAVEPLLRWAGSKRSLLNELMRRCPAGKWRYVEPFAGSACLFFALAPDEALLGDRNAHLISAYGALRDYADEVAAQVYAWPTDGDAYYAVRAKPQESLSWIEAAARFIYLNRLCFNGVYRTNRKGEFNVPYGRDPGTIPRIERFRQCAQLLSHADLRAGDFESIVASAGPGDFVYLDPPYSRAASDAYGVYGYGSFDARDLDRLLTCVRRLDEAGACVLLSYAWHERINELGPSWSVDTVDVRSQVGGRLDARTTRREVLVANYPFVR